MALHDLLPEGEDFRRAVKWISHNLEETPGLQLMPLVQAAIFKFDLSPKDADFLIRFYSNTEKEGT